MDDCYSSTNVKNAQNLVQKAIDNPDKLIYGKYALNAIANLYGLKLAPNNHWEYEQKIVIQFQTGQIIGGYNPVVPNETSYHVPSNDIFGNMQSKMADDLAVYATGELFTIICKLSIACIANTLAHEATHSWIEYKIEQKNEGIYPTGRPMEIHLNEEIYSDTVALAVLGSDFSNTGQIHSSQKMLSCEGLILDCTNPQQTLEDYYGIDLSDLPNLVSP